MSSTSGFRIGTRGSTMALAQTGRAADELMRAWPGVTVTAERFKPRGDEDQTSKLHKHGGKGGAFVAEIREAMRKGELEAAMHSLKDMPGDEETPGLVIGAFLAREASGDVIVLRPDRTPSDIDKGRLAGFKIGTNSVRRAAYLNRLYPAAEIIHYRGATDTRVGKLDARAMQKLPDGSEAGPADALVLAKSGLVRVGLANRISYEFGPSEMLPAIGQGIVALECREDDWETRERLAAIDNAEARACALAEREVLWVLNGHCNSPIAGHATLNGTRLTVRAAVISADGSKIIESERTGEKSRPRETGRAVGLDLLAMGAKEIIEATRV